MRVWQCGTGARQHQHKIHDHFSGSVALVPDNTNTKYMISGSVAVWHWCQTTPTPNIWSVKVWHCGTGVRQHQHKIHDQWHCGSGVRQHQHKMAAMGTLGGTSGNRWHWAKKVCMKKSQGTVRSLVVAMVALVAIDDIGQKKCARKKVRAPSGRWTCGLHQLMAVIIGTLC